MAKTVSTDQHMEWVRQSVADHGATLERYAVSLCNRRDLAADAVQETFVRLLHADRAQVSGYLLPWLLRVCRTRVLDLLRAESRSVFIEAAFMAAMPDTLSPTPAQAAAGRDELAALLGCVEQLPRNQREVVRLKFLNDLSYKEIAHVTGLSVSNVGFLLHAALKRLRGLVGNKEPAG